MTIEITDRQGTRVIGGEPDAPPVEPKVEEAPMVRVETLKLHRMGQYWRRPGDRYEETPHAAEQKVIAGLVKRLDGPSANAALSGPSETADAAPKWPLSMPPADYIAKYEKQDDLSPVVLERLELARKIVGSG